MLLSWNSRDKNFFCSSSLFLVPYSPGFKRPHSRHLENLGIYWIFNELNAREQLVAFNVTISKRRLGHKARFGWVISKVWKMCSTDMAKKSKDGLRDIARAARRDGDARNTRFRVELTHQKFHICTAHLKRTSLVAGYDSELG